MIFQNFKAKAFGKWILSGEHAVIRGGSALVFPLESKFLELEYIYNPEPMQVHFQGESAKEFEFIFWGVFKKALELAKVQDLQVTGFFNFQSSIPVGGGLGASATLCVLIGKWFVAQNLILQDEVYEFSRQLENLFHGESSGVDIAIALTGKPLRFNRMGERKSLELTWKPKWYLSHTQRRGVTSECVAKVKSLFDEKPHFANELDMQMKASVELAEKALSQPNDMDELKQALDLARDCFEKWGLAGGDVKRHIQKLESAGAFAIKPTGSGDGGYVLSLWKQDPPEDSDLQLIPL